MSQQCSALVYNFITCCAFFVLAAADSLGFDCFQPEFERLSSGNMKGAAKIVPNRHLYDSLKETFNQPLPQAPSKESPSLLLDHEEATATIEASAAQPAKDTSEAAAMNTAVTAVAAAAATAARTSKMQRWKGNRVVARVPAAYVQNSKMPSWITPGSA